MPFLQPIGRTFLLFLEATGRIALFTSTAVSHCVRPPIYPRLIARQMIEIGYYSLPVVGLTAIFTGMVLALLGVKNVHLIEATQKKAFFLRTVAATLGLAVTVHDQRAEDVKGLRAEIITARALAPLPELLKLANHFKRADSVLLFLKGAKAAEELAAARKSWCFDIDISKSSSDNSGNVLILRHVRHMQEVNHARSRARRAK